MTRVRSSADIAQGYLFHDAPLPSAGVTVDNSEPARTNQPVRLQQQANRFPFLSIAQVAHRYGVGKSTIWRWAAQDDNFPKPVKLSKGTSRWLESQLIAFEKSGLKTTSAIMGNSAGG